VAVDKSMYSSLLTLASLLQQNTVNTCLYTVSLPRNIRYFKFNSDTIMRWVGKKYKKSHATVLNVYIYKTSLYL